MSVRVVARIRPLLQTERDVDRILTEHPSADEQTSIVKIPNPKNLSEEYSFQFNSVYGQGSTQQQIFEAEVSPTVKSLFQGLDVTIFAYGSTGTGKTHTMRGGKTLADRGMIPRLLSNIYRKSKALEKNSNGDTSVQVAMSYYEIYNDRVFDLFEPPEKRNATGLPIREAPGGKTVIVGLTEEPCRTLKDFEALYDRANANRSTGATKLNAHSSRSHAILCVKVAITTPTETRISTASAIDLAGSEDNRRTGNGKDRMVESASINKSLFVLAQCVEAISKKQSRIPYRESKMTRILSLGQNNGITVMILNLAPTKAFHLDTLSSLNFANRTKKIEVREIENEPIFRGPPRPPAGTGPTLQRQPLRPLNNIINVNLCAQQDVKDKPAKAFAVYSDRSKPARSSNAAQKTSPLKRLADSLTSSRPVKQSRPNPITAKPTLKRHPSGTAPLSTATLEALIDSRVRSALATHTLAGSQPTAPPASISDTVQARLDSIEKRLENVADDERAEGLSFLFMAKQHQARGEDVSALKMYELACGYFPGNGNLEDKIERLRERVRRKREQAAEEEGVRKEQSHQADQQQDMCSATHAAQTALRLKSREDDSEADDSYVDHSNSDDDGDKLYTSDSSPQARPKSRKTLVKRSLQRKKIQQARPLTYSPDPLTQSPPGHMSGFQNGELTPRTTHLLRVINSRDVARIKQLQGVGPKRAEGIVEFLEELDEGNEGRRWVVEDWHGLLGLKGMGKRGVERMREAVVL